jgi:GDP-L-fucose synthase
MLGSSILKLLTSRFPDLEVLSPSRSELDLLESHDVEKYIGDHLPDMIIHCAAKVGGIQANIEDPWQYFFSNVRIDTNLVDAALKSKVEKLFYFGSSCMYPALTNQPMAEKQLLTGLPESTNEGYALAKIMGTKLIERAALQFDLDWHAFILSNLYGPKDSYNDVDSHLVAAIIKKISFAVKNKIDSVEMWGDGKARREFTFVEDVANFVVEKIDNSKEIPSVLNLGSNYDYSVLDFYKNVAKAMKYEGIISSNPSKPVGMERKLMDSSIASKFGWAPQTNLHDGLEQTIRYFHMESEVTQ